MKTPDSSWTNIGEFLTFWLENHGVLPEADQAVFRKYYGNYLKSFSEYTRHHLSTQVRDISDQIRAADAPKLLEIGTGCGTEALWFAYLGARVVTVDMSADRVSVARSRKQWLEQNMGLKLDVEFVEKSIFDFETEDKFDLIWMEMTYHHVEPRAAFGPRLLSLLRPGGRCHIVEVNAWNPLLQLQFLRERGLKTITFFEDEHGNRVPYGNERITTPGRLRASMRRAGFADVSTQLFRMLPNSSPPLSWLKPEAALVRLIPALAVHYKLQAVKGQ